MSVSRPISGLALPIIMGVSFWCGCVSGAAPATPKSSVAAPSAASAAALYPQIVKEYLAADWESLAPDLQSPDIAAMSKEQQVDVAYIRQAFNEGRPAWWKIVKQGKQVQIRPTIWQHTFAATYNPALANSLQYSSSGSTVTIAVNWPASDMDSPQPAEHGFTKGDLMDMGVFGTLEMAEIWVGLDYGKVSKFSAAARSQLDFYVAFRGNLASGYYGNPRGRRWTAFLSLDAFGDRYATAQNFMVRKPLGALLMAEIISHPEKYPSFRRPRTVAADSAEKTLSAFYMPQFERTLPTFAEDKALRELIKEFSAANGPPVSASGKVTLPNKLQMALDPAADADLAAKRNAWLAEEFAHPGIHAAATQPGTATRGANGSPQSP